MVYFQGDETWAVKHQVLDIEVAIDRVSICSRLLDFEGDVFNFLLVVVCRVRRKRVFAPKASTQPRHY